MKNKKNLNIRCVSAQSNLTTSIYYDTDWWQKTWALEWWNNNGHFNEELYRNILLAKLDLLNKQSNIFKLT
jgi:hypothetical protein